VKKKMAENKLNQKDKKLLRDIKKIMYRDGYRITAGLLGDLIKKLEGEEDAD
jgi:hypothetical protein